MAAIKADEIKSYLSKIYGPEVNLLAYGKLGKVKQVKDELKGYSYGIPLFIEFSLRGEHKKVVLETVQASPFGHDFNYDRAHSLLFSYCSSNKLPRHVRCLDVGAFDENGPLIHLGDANEFFMVNEFIEGDEYYKDLDAIRDRGSATPSDFKRAQVLSDYLVKIHKKKHNIPSLYTRRIRDLIGHGECIMGLIDNYPAKFSFITRKMLQEIEAKCVDWRWKIKDRGHRLSQVHGDFHPWNIIFRKGSDFTVLDRSRGEWGEPADDVGAMGINYIFFSLQKHMQLESHFKDLFLAFMENYLSKTQDQEILEVIQPFLVWRCLVIASPVWYPDLSVKLRRLLFNFIFNVLETKKFDIHKVNSYLKD